MSTYGSADPMTTHEVNLAAAYHDHISCTKLPSQFCKVGGNVSGVGESFNNCSVSGSSNPWLFSTSQDVSQEKIQLQRLKEMVLMQLDLIQHQQEQLLKKDRQLHGLKQEREELCLKVGRLENRITYLTKKLVEVAVDNQNIQITSQKLNETADRGNLGQDGSIVQRSGTRNESFYVSNKVDDFSSLKSHDKKPSFAFDNSISVKSEVDTDLERNSATEIDHVEFDIEDYNSLSTPNSEKKHFSIKEHQIENVPKKKSDRSKGENCEKTDESTGKSQKRSSNTNKKSKRLKSSQPSPSLELNILPKPSTSNINVLVTDEPYELYNGRREIGGSLEMSPLNNGSILKANIEVPSWRINQIACSNSTTGIEDIEDETFLKRHFKFEIEERRRKRWDIQRLREQRQNEKLRSGRYHNSFYEKPSYENKKGGVFELISFFPDPKDVKFIEVSEKLPVMAFGLPIPSLPPRPFSLPWYNSESKNQVKHQTSTRS